MPKGDSKGRKGKGPAQRPTTRHVLSEDSDQSDTDMSSPVSEVDDSLQPSTSQRSTESQEILNLHTEMVMKIRGIFSLKKEEWRAIRFQVQERKYLSKLDMDDVSNMLNLCDALKRKGVINRGEYSKLREILVTCDVEAGKIIDVYTERIRQEREGQTEAKRRRIEDNKRQRRRIGGQSEAKRRRIGGNKRQRRRIRDLHPTIAAMIGQPQAKRQRTVHNQRKRHSTVSRDRDKSRTTFAENWRRSIKYAQGIVRPFGKLTDFNVNKGLDIRKVNVQFTVHEDVRHLKKNFQQLIGQALGVDYRIVNIQMFIGCTIVSFDITGATHPLDESALALAERFTTGLTDGSILLTDETGNPLQIQQESIKITMKETSDAAADIDVPMVSIDQAAYCVVIGDKANLKSRLLMSTPITSVTWFRIDNENGTEHAIVIDNKKYFGGSVESPSLVIDNTTVEDTGRYVCHAENRFGVGKSFSTALCIYNSDKLQAETSQRDSQPSISAKTTDDDGSMSQVVTKKESPTSMADSPVQKIKDCHSTMVISLSKHFDPALKNWEDLLYQLSAFLDPVDLHGKDTNFIKICYSLMANGTIDYGSYDKLYEVIHSIDARPAKIIQETSDKIKDIQSKGLPEATRPKTGVGNQTKEGNDLPVEILQMDQQSIQLYRKCLEEKEEEDYRLRVIVIGQTEVGKTTLTRNLLRLPQIIPHTKSTDGVDIHNSFVNLDDKDWITDADMQHGGKCMDARLIQSLQSIASENTGADPNTEGDKSAQTASNSDDVSFSSGEFDNDDHQDTGADSNTEGDKSAQTASNSDVSFSSGEFDNDDQQNAGHARQIQSLDSTAFKKAGADPDDLKKLGPSTPANSNESVLKTLRNLMKGPLADRDYTRLGELSVWDFAGQFVFYTTHHTFLTHRAVYLLVTRLDQNINDTVGNDQCFLDATGCKEMKIKDFVSYWMNSVHLYSGAAEHLPPVILVGTHLDKVEGDREKKTKSYFEDLRNYLLDMKSPTSCHLIDTDYTVSNLPDELEIGNLRKKIVDLASKQAYWGEKIPAKWITLEKALMEKKIEGVNIMSYDNVVDLDKSTGVPIDDQEKLDLFLRFQHAKGNMIYFSEGCLRDHIVINPQWLIDAFKCIITARQFCNKNPALVQHWDALDKTGKLYLGMVDEIFRREDRFCRHKKHILGLMERLHIISHLLVDNDDDKSNTSEEKFYFVPSLLKDKVKECEIENFVKGTNGTPYLCYVFENNFLPTAVFHRLIAACLSEYTVAKRGSKFLIFCGCGIFDLNGGLTRLVVAFYDSVIQIGLFRLSEGGCAPETSTCVSVRQFVTETLEQVLRRYDMKLPFTLNLKCEKSHHLSHEGLLSVDVITGDEKVVCDDHEKKRHIINRDSLLHLWFPDKVSATDPNQGGWQFYLDYLASKLSAEISVMSVYLGLESGKLDEIKNRCKPNRHEMCFNVLWTWYGRNPDRETRMKQMSTALNNSDRADLAKELMEGNVPVPEDYRYQGEIKNPDKGVSRRDARKVGKDLTLTFQRLARYFGLDENNIQRICIDNNDDIQEQSYNTIMECIKQLKLKNRQQLCNGLAYLKQVTTVSELNQMW